MGQSMGSTGNSHKQAGAGGQKKNQPELHGGQRMRDQGKPAPKTEKTDKPDGGADHGPRSKR